MNRRGIILVGGLLAAVAAGAGLRTQWRRAQERAAWQAAQPARPELERAPAALRERLEAVESRLRGDARDIAALGELAQLYHANGFLREAERVYEGLVRFDATNPRWRHLLASLLAGYGRLDEAIAQWRQAVELAPEYVPARLRLGDALLKASRPADAAPVYRDVLTRAPDNVYALVGLARVDLAQERLTAAREKLSRAAVNEPASFAAQSLLASVYERLGNDEGAAVARARANDAGRYREAPDPWSDELLQFCYDAYRLQVAAATAAATGTPREAVPLLERALSFAPGDVRTLRQLGATLRKLRDAPGARRHLEKAVALAPTDAACRIELAQLYLEVDDASKALGVLRTGLEVCADKSGLHHQLAVTLAAIGRRAEAVPHLEAAARLSPEKPDAARELVAALFEHGREEEAIAALETALERHPEFPALLVLHARWKIAQNDAAAASALLRRAERAGAFPAELNALAAEYRRRFGRAP